MERLLPVLAPYMIVGQALLTVALLAYWNPGLKHLLGGDPHDPHFLGVADPHGVFWRIWIVRGGTLFMWFGSGLPKLMTIFKGVRPEPYDWSKMVRTRGWVWVLGGAGLTACAIFMPLTRVACATAVVMIAAAMILSSAAVWLTFKFGGRSTRLTPPGHT